MQFRPFDKANKVGSIILKVLAPFGEKRLIGAFDAIKAEFDYKLKNAELDPFLVGLVRIGEEVAWVKGQVEKIPDLLKNVDHLNREVAGLTDQTVQLKARLDEATASLDARAIDLRNHDLRLDALEARPVPRGSKKDAAPVAPPAPAPSVEGEGQVE